MRSMDRRWVIRQCKWLPNAGMPRNLRSRRWHSTVTGWDRGGRLSPTERDSRRAKLLRRAARAVAGFSVRHGRYKHNSPGGQFYYDIWVQRAFRQPSCLRWQCNGPCRGLAQGIASLNPDEQVCYYLDSAPKFGFFRSQSRRQAMALRPLRGVNRILRRLDVEPWYQLRMQLELWQRRPTVYFQVGARAVARSSAVSECTSDS